MRTLFLLLFFVFRFFYFNLFFVFFFFYREIQSAIQKKIKVIQRYSYVMTNIYIYASQLQMITASVIDILSTKFHFFVFVYPYSIS